MSWQAYVDDHLVGTGSVSQAAICGLDGSPWAVSAGLNIAAADATAIANGISGGGSALFGSGITLNGTKYITIRADDRSAYGKGAQGSGVCCVKTNSALVIAFYADPIQPGMCTTVTEKLADYLMENGF